MSKTHSRLVPPVTSTRNAFKMMHSRCSPSHVQAANYYLKGIRVCGRWHSYANFLADMGIRPEGMTLERKDNSKGYSPDNCVWATMETQLANRSDRTIVTHKLVGVRWIAKSRRYFVQIGKQYLGTYDNIFDAAARRKSAELRYDTK